MFAVAADGPVEFSGVENIASYRSSEWAERGFCRICGSNLFYRLVDTGRLYPGWPERLTIRRNFPMAHQIFIDDKPGWYDLANETVTMTGAEAFAAFAPPSPE